MSTENDILEQMKNIGVYAGNIMNANAVTEGVLSSLLSKKDEMPEDIFNKMKASLKEVEQGKSEMKEKLADIEKTLRKNGDNNSK